MRVASMNSIAKAVVACFGMLAFCAPANAITVTGTVVYYEQPETGAGDFGVQSNCCAHFNNLVTDTLGADGRPVYNTGYGGPTILQLNAGNTLGWWNAAQFSSNGTFTTNAAGTFDQTLYTPNGTGTNNLSAFQTAIFTTNNLSANTSYTISYTGDDDVFLALGNQVISQDGGIHAAGQFTLATFNTGAGNTPLTIFYADRLNVDSRLAFTIDATPVPGPIVGAGLPGLLMAAGALVVLRRRRNQAAVA
jgi:fibro-slime domain-containing protein